MAASISIESAARGAKKQCSAGLSSPLAQEAVDQRQWVAPKSGKTFETVNPANEQVLTLVAAGWALAGTGGFSLFLAAWLPGGPLQSNWASRAGTPPSLLPHASASSSGARTGR